MPTIDELVTAYHALSPSKQEAFLRIISVSRRPVDRLIVDLRALSPNELREVKKQVWPRTYKRRDQPSLELIRVTTWHVLLEMMKRVQFLLGDDWLLELTPKEYDAVPLEKWKNTWAGREVFEREGQDAFEAWAKEKKKQLRAWMQLQMKELVELVAHRLGLTRQRKHPKGGIFRKTVQTAKDEFLMGTGLDWPEIPSALCDQRQRRFSGDYEIFYERQTEYLQGPHSESFMPLFHYYFGSA